MRKPSLPAVFFAATLITGCHSPAKQAPVDILANHLDTAIRPADDFFRYANGGWIRQHPIPDEESSWGIGNLVIEENLKRLQTINGEAAATRSPTGTPRQQIGDFWTAAMDSAAIEKNGLRALQPWLNKIDSIQSLPALARVMAELGTIGVNSVVSIYASQDDKQSDSMALHFWQSGLFLPEREYYLKTDSTSLHILAGYRQLLQDYLVQSGTPANQARPLAENILLLETRLAKAHRKLADLRDPYRNYNKMPAAALFQLVPSLHLQQYFQLLNVPPIDSVIVGQPEYYRELEKVVRTTPVNTWKALLRFRLLNEFTPGLPDAFGQASFRFSKLLSGAKERKPRWKRVLQQEEGLMGELLGQLFVKEYFNAQAKQRYEQLVENIRNAYRDRIQQLDWMSDSTKQKALVKLAAIRKKVGYPNKWRNFSALSIGRDSYVQNLVNGNRFNLQYNLNKLGKPVDRDEWDMTPQTYNAYYNPSNNEIVLPAGIFTVPGYRDEELDDALVYGYAGASTIGHEITHGFDDEGRQFDEKGNLKSWWTPADADQFNRKADAMVRQFNGYRVIDTFTINGRATLGENIADLGGIVLGWDAFRQTAQFKKNEPISGLTPAQRYFLGYALGWLEEDRQEALRNQVLADVHSPARFRVNGPFADVRAFYEVFGVKPGDKMYLPDSARVKIW